MAAPDGSLWASLWQRGNGAVPPAGGLWTLQGREAIDQYDWDPQCDGLVRFDGETLTRWLPAVSLHHDGHRRRWLGLGPRRRRERQGPLRHHPRSRGGHGVGSRLPPTRPPPDHDPTTRHAQRREPDPHSDRRDGALLLRERHPHRRERRFRETAPPTALEGPVALSSGGQWSVAGADDTRSQHWPPGPRRARVCSALAARGRRGHHRLMEVVLTALWLLLSALLVLFKAIWEDTGDDPWHSSGRNVGTVGCTSVVIAIGVWFVLLLLVSGS